MLPTIRNYRSIPRSFFDEFFNDNFWNKPLSSGNSSNAPAVNVEESEKEYLIHVAAPGLGKKDFQITLDKNELQISSDKKNKKEENKNDYLRHEFSYTSFTRSFTLPENTVATKIKASHKNGILSISIPKVKEEVKKAIEININ